MTRSAFPGERRFTIANYFMARRRVEHREKAVSGEGAGKQIMWEF